MDRWTGKVAVVTGASSGIGAAVTRALANSGVVVVGLARRQQRVKEIADELKNAKGKVYSIKTDVTKEEEVIEAFAWVRDNLGGADILVNNAGVTLKTSVTDGETKLWRQMFELNVLAIGTCSREFIKSLKSRRQDNGHIVNISSVAAHRLSLRLQNLVYCSTKYAAKTVTEGLRLELAEMKSKIKVTNLSPGVVDTEIFQAGGWGNDFEGPKLDPSEVADAIVYVLSTPPNVQISELIIRPSGEGW